MYREYDAAKAIFATIHENTSDNRGMEVGAISDRSRVLLRIQELINVDSLVEANVTEPYPVLSQSVGRDHDELTLNVFV